MILRGDHKTQFFWVPVRKGGELVDTMICYDIELPDNEELFISVLGSAKENGYGITFRNLNGDEVGRSVDVPMPVGSD